MNNELLTEYQKYLRAKSLVQEKYITYYASWARKFLSFSNNNKELNHDLQLEAFLNYLGAQRGFEDWQIRQAHDAVRLYYNFTGEDSHNRSACALADIDAIINKMSQAIRESPLQKWIPGQARNDK